MIAVDDGASSRGLLERKETGVPAQTCDKYIAACPVGFIPPKVPYGSFEQQCDIGTRNRDPNRNHPNREGRFLPIHICRYGRCRGSPASDPITRSALLQKISVPYADIERTEACLWARIVNSQIVTRGKAGKPMWIKMMKVARSVALGIQRILEVRLPMDTVHGIGNR